MKKFTDHINKYRIRNGNYGSDDTYGTTGAFIIPYRNRVLRIVSADGMGWDHVSVSLENRCPNWEEMTFIKDLFWNDDEVVMQLHPAKKNYINCHPNCLHLWKPVEGDIPQPPNILVGIKE